jgi:hypothetical protein
MEISFEDRNPTVTETEFRDAILYFYIIDLFLSFITAVEKNNELFIDLATIAKTYIKTWFLIDAVSIIPGVLNFFI